MFYILLLAILFIFILAQKHFHNVSTSNQSSKYSKKSRVLNQSEQALYINLTQVLGSEYIVLSKVRIEDFVSANHWGVDFAQHYGNRGRIKSRHVDFLICDLATTKPLLAIELDGYSHNAPSRMSRDKFVDDLYHQINLPVKHIHVGADFSRESKAIRDALRLILQGQTL